MFRGYCHSNIPEENYDFILIDGPNFDDEQGSSCCLDALKIRLKSKSEKIIGVVDTRVSSVFVLQSIFGVKSFRYSNLKRTCSFTLRRISSKPKVLSTSFNYALMGSVKLKESAMKLENYE